MSKEPKSFSTTVLCLHCGNRAPMEIVSRYSQVKTHCDDSQEVSLGQSITTWDEGEIYELLLCPACNAIILRNYFWHEWLDPGDVEMKILYPSVSKIPHGLPERIKSAYEASERVKTIDPNAYGVLVGRVVEMVCLDRKAMGENLADKLLDLSNKGEIPEKLVGVAKSLRKLRNIGAHATIGELTKSEVPIVEDLCKAILEYVYSAPFLVQQVEERLMRMQQQATKTKKKLQANQQNENI